MTPLDQQVLVSMSEENLKLKAENKALREAAAAFLAAADSPDGDHIRMCICCLKIATKMPRDGVARCDGCAGQGAKGLSYAPALRALRALLEAP